MTKKRQMNTGVQLELPAVDPAPFVADLPTHEPAIDNEQATMNSLAVIARCMSDSDYRIVRRKIKVGGVWYHVEVSRP